MKRLIGWIVVLLVGICVVQAQELSVQERQQLRRKRQSSIELLHIGVGAESAFWSDWQGGVKVYFGVGSSRHIGCADIGLKYIFSAPMKPLQEERITLQQMPIYLSGVLHPVRWEAGCWYIGGEAAYHIETMAMHVIPSEEVRVSDRALRHHHATVTGKTGVKHRNWDVSVFYTYDIMPQYDQKYVYESPAYRYEALRGSLFERMRIGLSLSYAFPLKIE